jgi:hypothetical protein
MHKKLAPGVYYYENAIRNSGEIIKTIEHVQQKLKNGERSVADVWDDWVGNDKDNEVFCKRHFILDPDRININDPLQKELSFLYNSIFYPIEYCLSHYVMSAYPALKQIIKSPEGQLAILKYGPGSYLPEHQDQGVSSRVISSIAYLNDDYEGGEITFPYLDLSIKPSAGSVLFFPSNFVYGHSVKEIINGYRYSVPQFYRNSIKNGAENLIKYKESEE